MILPDVVDWYKAIVPFVHLHMEYRSIVYALTRILLTVLKQQCKISSVLIEIWVWTSPSKGCHSKQIDICNGIVYTLINIVCMLKIVKTISIWHICSMHYGNKPMSSKWEGMKKFVLTESRMKRTYEWNSYSRQLDS